MSAALDPAAALAGVSLPSNYTFVAADAGAHAFTVTLKTVGSQTVTASDITDGSKTANASPNITVNAGLPSTQNGTVCNGPDGPSVQKGVVFPVPQRSDANDFLLGQSGEDNAFSWLLHRLVVQAIDP